MVAKSSEGMLARYLQSRRGRLLLENLMAYLFIAPAGLLIFIFGIFPVAFSFFVSLHRWRRNPEEFRGLDQYVNALGSFAYVLFFWLAVGVLYFGLRTVMQMARETHGERRLLLHSIPGVSLTVTGTVFIVWLFTLLPVILGIPQRLRGQAVTRDSFVNELAASFTYPGVAELGSVLVAVSVGAALIVAAFALVLRGEKTPRVMTLAASASTALTAGAALMALTLAEISTAIDEAQAAGTVLPVWSQVVIIGAGAGLIGLGLWLWQQAVHDTSGRPLVWRAIAVVVLVVAGTALVRELPPALAAADSNVLRGFNVALMFSLFSVPLQIALGLGLAVLLYQKLKGKSIYRMLYFLPYITPFVATSVVFSLIFSHNPASPANQLMNTLGLEAQNWLREPRGLFRLIFGESVPDALTGPGLALVVIILYNVWIYAGYSAVIFLAGLGNISQDFYEAARIDGANGWQQFRHITLPLLSPTTFFLILVATIGTLQAFTQIYLMRKPGGYNAVDTINLTIFNQIQQESPNFGYGSAMAFVLFAVILALTVMQNRAAGRSVFYG